MSNPPLKGGVGNDGGGGVDHEARSKKGTVILAEYPGGPSFYVPIDPLSENDWSNYEEPMDDWLRNLTADIEERKRSWREKKEKESVNPPVNKRKIEPDGKDEDFPKRPSSCKDPSGST